MKLKFRRSVSFLMAILMILLVVPFSNVKANDINYDRSKLIQPVTDDEGFTTFKFLKDETVNTVKLAGSFTDWETGAINMEKDSEGNFIYSIKLEPGEYLYKYIINDQWISGDNLKFEVKAKNPENPEVPENQDNAKRLIVHFDNPDNENDWNIWSWSKEPHQEGHQYNMIYKDSYGVFTEVEFSGNTKKAGVIFKQGNDFGKQATGDIIIELNQEETHVWFKKGEFTPHLENPNKEDLSGRTKLIIHFNNAGNEEWLPYIWVEGQGGKQYPFTRKDSFGDVAEITLDGEYKKAGIIIKTESMDPWVKNYAKDRFIEIKNNPQEVWLRDRDPEIYYKRPIRLQDEKNSMQSLKIDGLNELTLKINRKIDLTYLKNNYQLFINGNLSNDKVKEVLVGDNQEITKSDVLLFKLNEEIDFNSEIVLKSKISEDEELQEVKAEIGKVVSTKEFDEKYKYDGKLGPIYTEENTEFRLWAPTASAVDLLVFEGDEVKQTIAMKKGEKGVYSHVLEGNQLGTVYMYDVHFGNQTNRTVDPYAKAVTINGEKSVVANPKPTQVPRPAGNSIKNPIIYELHVRDLSSQDISGIKDKGTFNGLVEKGTKTPTGQITGFDYIKSLGITHVQLLPIYDYKTVDEKNPKSGFNWGYDPLNYNAVEGSYSTNPNEPFKRIEELQNAVDEMHKAGLGVIMDVVYNHVFNPNGHAFEKIVPGYYFRQNDKGEFLGGTGVGNETASERAMVQKYMIDSITYWAKTFNLDGFRFDLMGTHDIETINKIYSELKKINPNIFILGEGWNMNMGIPEDKRATQKNAYLQPNIAFFSDDMRDAIRGNVFNAKDKGFATGNPTNEAFILQNVKGGMGLKDKSYLTARQVIQYAEAHDNLTLWDKIKATNPNEADETSLKRHKLATSIIMLSQGIPFVHAGQEFARTKGGDENSYKSPDSVNQFDWNRVEKMADNVDFFRELVKIRKSHEIFNLTDYVKINKVFKEIKKSEGVAAYSLTQENGKKLYIAYNGSEDAKEIPLENGNYKVLVKNQKANHEGLEDIQVRDGKIQIEGISSLVLESYKFEELNPDKTELKALIDKIRAIKNIDEYTHESSAELRRKLGEAQRIYEKLDASKEEINKAKDELNKAFENLVKIKDPNEETAEETAEETTKETTKETNKETTEETVEETNKETAEETSKETNKETTEETSSETTDESSGEGDNGSSGGTSGGLIDKPDNSKNLRLEIKNKDIKLEVFNKNLLELIQKSYKNYKYMVYDINLVNSLGEKVHSDKLVKVKVDLKDLGLNENNKSQLKIWTIHNNEILEIKDFEVNGSIVSFNWNKFSYFVFVLGDKVSEGNNSSNSSSSVNNNQNPVTGDTGVMLATMTMIITGGASIILAKRKKEGSE